MSATTTHTWAVGNLHPKQCRGCGVFTEGWAPTYTGEVRHFGSIELKVRGRNYALCPHCGGECCGDCKTCEFGYPDTGGPTACSPIEAS